MTINKKFNVPTTRELFKSIPSIRREWKQMSPMQKWCYLFGIGKCGFGTIKFSTFSENAKKMHWIGYYCWTYVFNFIQLMLYTFYYYLSRGDLLSCLPCTCMAGILGATIPMTIKYTIGIRNRINTDMLGRFGGLYIYHDGKFEDTKYNEICSKQMDVTMRSLLFKMTMMALSAVAVCLGPIQAYVLHGIKSSTWEVRIPFTEPKSDAEFLVNVLLHFNLILHGFFGYIGMEVWMSLVENTVNISPKLFKLEMERICDQWKVRAIPELEMRLRFRNLVEQSLDADNFVGELSNCLYHRTLVTPIIFTYTIGMAIFCQYHMDFVAGYGIAMLSWVQLFFVCELGEKAEDNGFAEIIYQVEWETLPLDIQKDIMHLINQKQNVSGIKLGPFGMGINRDIFKVCTNKIFTFVMFLKNVYG